eukprot:m.43766 g.43766  ORF g.43766 m.43766 type:complete len:291 (+) comp11659_c0_seq1:121-993(+)
MVWSCSACTFSNADNDLLACAVCDSLRDDLIPASFAASGACEARRSYACLQCKQDFDDISDLYSLDACSHRFCFSCMDKHVADSLREKLATDVACPECDTALSVRDVQDFARRRKAQAKTTAAAVSGSRDATRRLMQEIKAIRRSKDASAFMTVSSVGDTLYEWQVELINFNPDDPDKKEAALARDLKGRAIILRVHFSSTFPSSPPYIRVIEPRFQFRTGHVTVGGSICTEVLTNQGWDPSLTLESVLLSIRSNMIVGGGRIDKARKDPYGEKEAREAFERMRRQHGWY